LGLLPSKRDAASDVGDVFYFSVLYTKASGKKLRKNKSFADGVLEIKLPTCRSTLHDEEGKAIASTTLRGYAHPSQLGNGSEIKIGNWELEVDASLPVEPFRSGKAFLKPCNSTIPAEEDPDSKGRLSQGIHPPTCSTAPSVPFRRPLGLATATASLGTHKNTYPKVSLALHDPLAPGACILNHNEWEQGGRQPSTEVVTPCVSPVVLDPFLARKVRFVLKAVK